MSNTSNQIKTEVRKIAGVDYEGKILSGKFYPYDWPKVCRACAQFMPASQLRFCMDAIKGEEGQYFIDTLTKMAAVWEAAPATYGTNGTLQEDKTAVMHFFGGRIDFYMVEKDAEQEQEQAYGYYMNGNMSGFTYVDLEGLKRQPIINVDFHYMPETIATLRLAGKIR